MATMDSMSVWAAAAGGRQRGMAWRDAVTERVIAADRYVPYDKLVAQVANELGLSEDASDQLGRSWMTMAPWPDAQALESVGLPYAFVTNCSTELAMTAVERSGLQPVFTLSAEEVGHYKPHPEMYLEACRRMAADPPEILMVAGAPYDALGARRVGLRTYLVARRPVDVPLPASIRLVSTFDEALAGL
jgi:2-haloalkanoic acid dehalogenase type II